MTGEARADAIFTLPTLPRRAAVFAGVDHWRAGLEARGVEVVEAHDHADLVVIDGTAVAPPNAAAIIIDGVKRVDRRQWSGYRATRLTSVPPHGDPGLLLNLGHHRAAAHGLRSLVPAERARRARNIVAASLVRTGLLPPVLPLLVTLARDGGRSAFDAGPEAGVPAGSEWYLAVAAGSITRRSAFHVLAPGSSDPDVIVKLSRVPGLSVQFDRDEAAFAMVERAGGCVAAHAPRLLSRFQIGEHHASVETAARGVCLTRLLTERGSSAGRVALASTVAQWLVDVARDTAHAPEALASHRARLATTAEQRVGTVAAERFLGHVADVPAVLTHGEVFEDHVFVDDGRITVIDWEHTQEHGFPLWDLAFFAANALSAVDGVGREEPRDLYVQRLFTGSAPSSPVLFRWVRNAVGALDLDPDAVGALIALYWIERSELSRVERQRAEAVSGAAVAPSWLETTADRWFEHPQLGEEWHAWR